MIKMKVMINHKEIDLEGSKKVVIEENPFTPLQFLFVVGSLFAIILRYLVHYLI